MPVTCYLRVLPTRLTVERGKHKQPIISLRHLAWETSITLSVLVAWQVRQA
jgi:hypothetical protein